MISPGRLLISFVALVTAVSPYLADWNETHIHNDAWTGHAKFHNAQTMLLGALLGGCALAVLWLTRSPSISRLRHATLLASLYWVSQAGSILFPGAEFVDPEFADRLPEIAGWTPNQMVLSGMFLGLLLIGYGLETRRHGGAVSETVRRQPAPS